MALVGFESGLISRSFGRFFEGLKQEVNAHAPRGRSVRVDGRDVYSFQLF